MQNFKEAQKGRLASERGGFNLDGPLIEPENDDAKALRFDALMYGIELAYLAGKKYNRGRTELIKKDCRSIYRFVCLDENQKDNRASQCKCVGGIKGGIMTYGKTIAETQGSLPLDRCTHCHYNSGIKKCQMQGSAVVHVQKRCRERMNRCESFRGGMEGGCEHSSSGKRLEATASISFAEKNGSLPLHGRGKLPTGVQSNLKLGGTTD